MGYVGFAKLRRGRIHMFCPRCGRKLSNMQRDEETDPRSAVLVHVFCLRCSEGCKETPMYFYNARGQRIRDKWERGLA